MFSLIKKRKIWFSISGILVFGSVISFLIFGLKPGIDFTGGTLMELDFLVSRPTNAKVEEILSPLGIGNITVQPVGESGLILRFKEIDETTHQQIIDALEQSLRPNTPEIESDLEGININFQTKVLEEKQFDSIGPVIGQELREKTIWATIIVILAIIVYIAWAFRKISKPVASWKYGVIAVIALGHDIMITIGVFILLGQFYNIEVNAPFVAALLTILGYSVNDTIVVFDRTRENLVRRLGQDFEEIVEESVNEVITRSINASFTTLLVLFAILMFGGQTIRDFVLALIIGISVGTYSSIFLASPLLVTWEKLRSNK
ncbi:MAG: protein translocase subunit SecF [Patescibacteria group bacterium]|jgi:preprotein translocase subunit SecF|nr:protein translocase subunit SecF [Patescibacteria group bacterium]